MDKKKLNAKDFINIGIFTVIYFVMFFITGMLGYIPMHIPEAFIIPFSVMFRFFPTIFEEAESIGNAMRMRGITEKNFFKNPQAVLEYRIVPLMMSVVTIGNDLSAAALTRGLGNGKKRTSICKIGFHWKDFVIMFIVTVALLVFLLFSGGLK